MEFWKNMVAGVVRHLLTTAGGALTANGIVSASDWEAVIGASSVVIGVIWSLIAKRNAA